MGLFGKKEKKTPQEELDTLTALFNRNDREIKELEIRRTNRRGDASDLTEAIEANEKLRIRLRSEIAELQKKVS